jgi:3'5'-cyclic nucleotide phosphodiesterase
VVRRFSINNILATDMKRHFELIKQVEIKITKMNETGEPIVQKEDDRRLISGVFTHIFDLAGSTKSYDIAK